MRYHFILHLLSIASVSIYKNACPITIDRVKHRFLFFMVSIFLANLYCWSRLGFLGLLRFLGSKAARDFSAYHRCNTRPATTMLIQSSAWWSLKTSLLRIDLNVFWLILSPVWCPGTGFSSTSRWTPKSQFEVTMCTVRSSPCAIVNNQREYLERNKRLPSCITEIKEVISLWRNGMNLQRALAGG